MAFLCFNIFFQKSLIWKDQIYTHPGRCHGNKTSNWICRPADPADPGHGAPLQPWLHVYQRCIPCACMNFDTPPGVCVSVPAQTAAGQRSEPQERSLTADPVLSGEGPAARPKPLPACWEQRRPSWRGSTTRRSGRSRNDGDFLSWICGGAAEGNQSWQPLICQEMQKQF